MRHIVGIGVLVAVGLALRFWLHTNLALDISVHDVYRVIPLSVVGFWFLVGTACLWVLVVAWASIRRHSFSK
jgi:hypothetical protein